VASRTSVKGLKVLVVEDEALISMFIEDSLADIGCETVAIASNLTDAKVKVAEVDYDIVVLDVNLGGKQTFELAESLAERQLPFIFSTGYGHAGVPPHLHHVPILQKPFQEGQLKDALLMALTGEGS